jgi:hypothetical protein
LSRVGRRRSPEQLDAVVAEDADHAPDVGRAVGGGRHRQFARRLTEVDEEVLKSGRADDVEDVRCRRRDREVVRDLAGEEDIVAGAGDVLAAGRDERQITSRIRNVSSSRWCTCSGVAKPCGRCSSTMA